MNVMKKAWKIAKRGAVDFGGSSKQYLAEALKLAWAENKSSIRVKAVGRNEQAVSLYKNFIELPAGTVKKWQVINIFVESVGKYFEAEVTGIQYVDRKVEKIYIRKVA